MAVHGGAVVLLGFLVFLKFQRIVMGGDCPLDLSASNFTLAASACSNNYDRGKCCHYVNAFVAVAMARYANLTSNLGVPSELSEVCLHFISGTLELYGIPPNATVFCALGTKIPVNYECEGRTTVMQMLQSPEFGNVTENCKLPLSVESSCRQCINAGIVYLHHLGGADNNMTLVTCRDATFAALASQGDNESAIEMASCFFGVQGLSIPSEPSPPSLTPEASPSTVPAASPSQSLVRTPLMEYHHTNPLMVIAGVGSAVTVVAVWLLIVLIFLIHRKSKELEDSESPDKTSWKALPHRLSRKCQEGPSSKFRKFMYKEIKKATDSFSRVIGRGGFGTVYKAQFSDGFVAAVKRMNKASEQGEDEFCREMELLGRLHHRHLVALRGFCVEKHERFLMYEYMENGSLKNHLHSPGRTPLSWQTRIQIAIDVANALEYLHFYCDPPLCHRDINSSNILLDDNFVAKVADFGLAHASKSSTVSFEPVNTDIRGTPGYMDPEYMVTRELTEKSDVYSYGVLLLELVTARRAIQDSRNLVEWSQVFMATELRLPELVDPAIGDSFDSEQLQTIVTIVRWCTQREGRARPSIKQVLRLLYETSDPMHSGFIQAMQDEDYDGTEVMARNSKGKVQRGELIFHSGDARYLPSSSSTSRSYCSRSFLLETGSPQSPPGIFSV
ncbi:probable receptor-like protein kinase At1g49730 isoform X2 [Telopea speciosissima]|uniref:probable receptor-like protein kinase At1g49730 isoform X1 n=1 Tax=Telopea speciosissima TaxID=54955 RepID=UPI001CC3948C|nr:probable receptor-like protein kinase At1g49730 isoform X1 [Telopea speciosissima]XP_043713845.1 probable receptor-like protein kinase At1g49730 isoform X1 [Telopea speciosissima]XP_043713846.1 probable receptor-like protein kinase At1g49730 isoform X2 [Telopea speciosissima]